MKNAVKKFRLEWREAMKLSRSRKAFGRKGMIFFVRVAAKKCIFFGEFGGENANSPKERCDFVESLCGWEVYSDRKICWRESRQSEGKV